MLDVRTDLIPYPCPIFAPSISPPSPSLAAIQATQPRTPYRATASLDPTCPLVNPCYTQTKPAASADQAAPASSKASKETGSSSSTPSRTNTDPGGVVSIVSSGGRTARPSYLVDPVRDSGSGLGPRRMMTRLVV